MTARKRKRQEKIRKRRSRVSKVVSLYNKRAKGVLCANKLPPPVSNAKHLLLPHPHGLKFNLALPHPPPFIKLSLPTHFLLSNPLPTPSNTFYQTKDDYYSRRDTENVSNHSPLPHSPHIISVDFNPRPRIKEVIYIIMFRRIRNIRQPKIPTQYNNTPQQMYPRRRIYPREKQFEERESGI